MVVFVSVTLYLLYSYIWYMYVVVNTTQYSHKSYSSIKFFNDALTKVRLDQVSLTFGHHHVYIGKHIIVAMYVVVAGATLHCEQVFMSDSCLCPPTQA